MTMSKSTIEALKEIWRWFYSFFVAKIFETIIGLLVSALPFFPVKIFPEHVMLWSFSIPVQMLVSSVLIPAIIRGLDKYKYTQSKEGFGPTEAKGLPGFNLLNGLG